mgnify:CR=1 FL=1
MPTTFDTDLLRTFVAIAETGSFTRAAEREGILAMFRALGCVVTPPGCGSCIGNGPGIPLDGETTASTTNRRRRVLHDDSRWGSATLVRSQVIVVRRGAGRPGARRPAR